MFMLVIWLMQAVVIDEYNTVPPKKKKTLVKGPWSTTPFFLTAKRSQMLVAWYLHLDFFGIHIFCSCGLFANKLDVMVDIR